MIWQSEIIPPSPATIVYERKAIPIARPRAVMASHRPGSTSGARATIAVGTRTLSRPRQRGASVSASPSSATSSTSVRVLTANRSRPRPRYAMRKTNIRMNGMLPFRPRRMTLSSARTLVSTSRTSLHCTKFCKSPISSDPTNPSSRLCMRAMTTAANAPRSSSVKLNSE